MQVDTLAASGQGFNGQNFHVERTEIQWKAWRASSLQRCRRGGVCDWIQNDLLDGYSDESATRLMRQVVAPMAMMRHSCMRAMGECEGKRVLRLQNSISIAELRLPRRI